MAKPVWLPASRGASPPTPRDKELERLKKANARLEKRAYVAEQLVDHQKKSCTCLTATKTATDRELTALPPDVPRAQACRALNVPRHWCYPDRRQRKWAAAPTGRGRGLTEAEEQRILDALHSERFLDAVPRQVYATLLSEGIVLGSISTMYRLLGVTGHSRPLLTDPAQV